MNKIITGLLLTFSLVFVAINSNAQTKSYKAMMDDMSYNFYEVVDAAEAYFAKNGTGKGSGFKGYQRWVNENESKYYPTGKRSDVNHYLPTQQYNQIVSQFPNYKQKTSFDNGWEELGPWDANNVTSHYSPGIGRIETFWVDTPNTDRMFVGSRSGGFWKTTDGGNTWTNTTDFLVASGVFNIGVNPSNTDNVQIAVQNGGNGYSHGIYTSTDGGDTWTESAFNPTALNWGGLGDNEKIYKISYHPTIANKVFIGTTKGLYVSNDNLASYNFITTGSIRDIEFHPTKSNVMYIYNYSNGRNNVFRSFNTGASFTSSSTISGNNNARGYLAVTPTKPDNVYFASSNGVWSSINEAGSFIFRSNPDESCQGFAVSDLDEDYMMYGYVDPEASANGGFAWTQTSEWNVQDARYVHADIRTIECLDGVFYMGTDGYFVKSIDNGATWTILNDGTAVREFYAVGVSQGNSKVAMAGSQDNGTSIVNEDGWIEWNGGDGMEAVVLPLNDLWMIGSWQYGTRNVTVDGGYSRNGTGNPDGGSANAAWEAPLLTNPLNNMQVIHFSDSMFKGHEFGAKWEQIGSPVVGKIAEAAIAWNDSNIIAASRASSIKITLNGGLTWSSIASGLPTSSITDIAFDPRHDSTIIVTYNRYQNDGNKVYISHDLGQTWINITYNIGNMPLRTVVVDHDDSSYIYVGGEIGVYYKPMEGTTWKLYNQNLPNVTVKDLEVHYGSNTLKAATWGRGLWEYTTVGRNDYPSIHKTNISSTPDYSNPKSNVDQFVFAEIEYDGSLSSAFVVYSMNDIGLEDTIKMYNKSDELWESETSLPQMENGNRMFFKVIAIGSDDDKSETYRFDYITRGERSAEIEETVTEPIKIVPNPNNGQFQIVLNTQNIISSVRIIDIQGKEVFAESNIDSTNPINTNLASGAYVVIVNSEGNISEHKIIVE